MSPGPHPPSDLCVSTLTDPPGLPHTQHRAWLQPRGSVHGSWAGPLGWMHPPDREGGLSFTMLCRA